LKVIKIGTKVIVPYKENLEDTIKDIWIKFNEKDFVEITLITESGYIIYDDQLNDLIVMEDGNNV